MARSGSALAAPADDGDLERLALELDLTSLAAALPAALSEAEQTGLSYSDFAGRLLRIERDARDERKRERSIKCARMGVVEGLDGFDFSLRPRLEARVVRELLNCRWANEGRNILCLGGPGRGKTRVIKALAHAACLEGHTVRYVNAAEMLEDLHGSLADGTWKRTFRRYVKPRVLALDEFGYQPMDEEATNYLFRVVSARHGTGTILLAANAGFSGWKRFFPSEAQAVASVDRLVDQATILRFTGKSCRSPKEIHGAELDESPDS